MPSHYSNPRYDVAPILRDPYAARKGSGPRRPKEPVPGDEPALLRAFDPNKLYYAWLGHSSVLLVMNGVTILVDPILSGVAGPFRRFGAKRFPGRTVRPEELPEPDYIVITHDHYDHLDKKTIRALDTENVRYICPLGVERYLSRFGVDPARITPMDRYERRAFGGIIVTCCPAYHYSGRGLFTGKRTLWASFRVEDGKNSAFFTGDSAYAPHFKEIRERFGPVDIVFSECGQYNGLWHSHHMFPEESVKACLDLGAEFVVPVHWGAYALAEHPWEDPPRRFALRADECALPFSVPVRNRLETVS